MFLLLSYQWRAAAVMAVFLVGSILVTLMRRWFPSLLALLFVVVALINAPGWIWDLYPRLYFYDEFAHAVTMAVIGLTFAYLAITSSAGTWCTPGPGSS